jgi:hypothetical protein
MVNKERKPVEARVDEVMQIERFGYLQKLLRVTAKVLRFIRIIKRAILDLTRARNYQEDRQTLRCLS